MRRLIIILMAIVITTGPANAAELAGDSGQDSLFVRAEQLSDSLLIRDLAPSWHKWTAFKGDKKISEREFLKIAGRKAMYKDADDYYSRSMRNGSTGLILALGGAVMIALAATHKKTHEVLGVYVKELKPNATFIGVGGALMVLGTIAIMDSPNDNLLPYGTAKRIADEYNAKLQLQIKKSF
jgi:hypothetical protein